VSVKFKDDDGALSIANDTLYGLGAGVWTRNGTRATLRPRHPGGTRVDNCYHLYQRCVSLSAASAADHR
jgi:aldehyde dehydrogenase